METNTIAKVNEVVILMANDEQKLVPIKPICEALGIEFEPQRRKLNDDDFLNSVTTLGVSTGSDGKEYEMVCLPLKYIFGWLFTINPKNVKLEAQEAVSKYRIECYDALYRNFSEPKEFLESKQKMMEKEIGDYQRMQYEFKTAKERLAQSKERLNKITSFTIEDWRDNNRQMILDFKDEEEQE
jgi:hypothetical protein